MVKQHFQESLLPPESPEHFLDFSFDLASNVLGDVILTEHVDNILEFSYFSQQHPDSFRDVPMRVLNQANLNDII